MNSDRRPNLLFIMDDQHRFDYLGCAGASFVRTPHLDSLAARGMRFTTCCSNAPICAPARIGLATGLRPDRLGAVENDCYLPARVPTYYQRLRDHGYRVGCVGKLDLAKPSPYNGRRGDRPCVFGWGFTHPEECEGKMHAGQSPTPLGPYGFWLQERGLYASFHADYQARAKKGWIARASYDSVLPADAFEDEYIGDRATQWIENVPDDFPWHLFVSFVGPHDPYDPPKTYADRWRNGKMPAAIPANLTGKPAWLVRRQHKLSPEEVMVTRQQYAAAIELIDDKVAQILAALARRGMADNTYVVFSSDHGEMLGDHGLYRKGVAYEAALRVPLIVTGPGIPADKVSHTLVELSDLNPTLCELAGTPALENTDARSLEPVLREEAAEHRTDTISVLNNFRCLRTARHKLIMSQNDLTELYDLTTDPHEQMNLAAAQPDLVRELSKRLHHRFLEGETR